jgi:hypothetical protein
MVDAVITELEQLELWVLGRPLHRSNRGNGICCPDFSCCRGVETIVPRNIRIQYMKAHLQRDWNTTDSMLAMFLGRALAGDMPDKKIHITRGEPDDHTEH